MKKKSEEADEKIKSAKNNQTKTKSKPLHETVEGKVVTINTRAGFIKCEGRDQDIIVPSHGLKNALLGDLVRVELTKKRSDGRAEGVVVLLLSRGETKYVGVIEVGQGYAFVVTDTRQMSIDIYVPKENINGAKTDDKVMVEIVNWPAGTKNPIGRVVQVFGAIGDNNAEMHSILAEYGLPYKFEDAVEKAANKISTKISAAERKNRRDFTSVPTFTIDPFDAKDFDDALSVRKVKEGVWEVGVHIADVTHYVTESTIIEKEAFARATSVYLVDRVVPMLPEKLSNDLCSLRPNEDKLCFSAVFELNEDAEVLSEWFGRTVIHSDRRFSYDEAQTVIETGEGDMKEEIVMLNTLAQKMRKDRYAHGSIAFERDEVKFKLDENGKPLGVYYKVIKESNQLIEEFMLLANRKVAEFIGARRGGKRTFVYRIHDKPNDEKYAKFGNFAAKFGYSLRAKTDRAIAKELNKLLNSIKGKKVENLFSTLALRAMAKAIYSTENIGHYGLAFKYYTHFTSPIRRYPDMMVHRLLQHYLDGGSSPSKEHYEELCNHATEREIKAAEAERSSIKYKMVEFMQDKIGQEFDGYISGITDWGVYVELAETKIEGMASVRDMQDDNYIFEEDNYRLIGYNRRRVITLGDPVKIVVKGADLRKKQLDFALTAHTDLVTEKEYRFPVFDNSAVLSSQQRGNEQRRSSRSSRGFNAGGGVKKGGSGRRKNTENPKKRKK